MDALTPTWPGEMAGATESCCRCTFNVTARPAVIPSAAPKTTSVAKWRDAARRELPTYRAITCAGTPTFHPRCRWSTAAVANADDVWPEGNEYGSPSGRVRRTTTFRPSVIAPF